MTKKPALAHPNIGFCGFPATGKDELAKALVLLGYTRLCPADIIKQQLDSLIRHYFKFSAWTEDREQKEKIRPVLEAWGTANYGHIFNTYFDTVEGANKSGKSVVNTRVLRLAEARHWKRTGGVLVAVTRRGTGPATLHEANEFEAILDAGLVDSVVENDSTIEALHTQARKLTTL